MPGADPLALYFACKAWQKTIARHNEIAETAQDWEVRPIKAPPDAYLVTTVALVEWALASGCWDRLLKLGATIAEVGNLDVLKLYRERGGEWGADRRERFRVEASFGVCTGAAAGGHLAVLQWAHHNGCLWGEMTCERAAKGGHLVVLQWARQNGCPWDQSTCSGAADGGHLAVLQWARQNGCPWDEETCTGAALGGHLAVLQWARQNGCSWNEGTCAWAAGGGHLAVLQWAHQKGCPWDEGTCSEAAEGGHLVVLQWARQNGCPWDKDNCARYGKTEEMRAWIESQQ